MKKIVIVGNGGMASEIKWMIDRINYVKPTWKFCGFVVNELLESDELFFGNDEYLLSIEEEMYVAIAIGNCRVRKKLAEEYIRNEYLKFPNLIDPSVIISEKIKLGKGNIIAANSVFTVNCILGDFNIINLFCTISHDTVIGNYNNIQSGSNISGNVTIMNEVEIGTGTQVIQGKKIHSNSTIGAGAVVIRDIPGKCTAVGVLTRVIKINNK